MTNNYNNTQLVKLRVETYVKLKFKNIKLPNPYNLDCKINSQILVTKLTKQTKIKTALCLLKT